MISEDTRGAVMEILADIAPDAELGRLSPDACLRDKLGFDSIDWLNFVAALHERLGVAVPEADYPQIATLAGCATYVAARRVSH